MPLAGFESTVPTNERQQTHALDRAATGTGRRRITELITWTRILLNKLIVYKLVIFFLPYKESEGESFSLLQPSRVKQAKTA